MASQQQNSGGRDIMYTPEDGITKVKFISVPHEFAFNDIKHADLVGMYNTFNDGQTWLVVDGKRLFRMEDDLNERHDESASDYEVMGPEELQQFLRGQPSYDELHAQLEAVLGARSNAIKGDHFSCSE